MEHSCYKCGHQVEDGVAFCTHCGAPQIRVAVAEPGPASDASAVPSPEPFASSPAAGVDRTGPSQSIYWAQGLPAAAIAGLIAGFGMMFIGLFGMWMLAGGFLSVVFYRQRTRGGLLFPRAGARLGAVSGILGFAVFAVITVPTGLFRSMLLEMMHKYSAQHTDPQLQALVERWLETLKTPEGLAAWLIGLFFFLLLASAIGGALGGRVLSRRGRHGPFPS
jgi:zinc-ribbon domain